MRGERVHSHDEFWDAGPGAYLKVGVREGGERFETWLLRCPGCGRHFHLAHNPAEGPVHTWREEADGSLTVPRTGGGNSILCPIDRGGCGWHGWIEHGVWSTC